MKKIYLDNAATTQVDPKVLDAMVPYFSEKFGNPSSQHSIGQEIDDVLVECRGVIGDKIGAKGEEIIFTGSGTEANNFVLKGLFFANFKNGSGKNHIITTKIEHDCILNTCKWLEKQGARVSYLNVDSEGFVDLEELNSLIDDETLVVSVIHGNNEVGVIQDLEAIGKICKEKGVYFHSDACQSFTKVDLNVGKMNLDFLTLNAHKIHGPKGVGVLYVSSKLKGKIEPLLHGGGQEFGLRSSTENVSGIVGFAKAVEVVKVEDSKNRKLNSLTQKNKGSVHCFSDVDKMTKLRDRLIKGLLEIENVRLNGAVGDDRLCNNVNISFNNIEGEAISGFLDLKGVACSTGSACSSNTLEPSHVLKAMGLKSGIINTTIRMSISKYNTPREIDYVLKVLPGIVNKLREMSPLK
ncbi:cysteine desulfurase [archaeon]|jgi:cysteine desulfurase|nr:cysteine desulfurase [archaeon]